MYARISLFESRSRRREDTSQFARVVIDAPCAGCWERLISCLSSVRHALPLDAAATFGALRQSGRPRSVVPIAVLPPDTSIQWL
jgi:hypothetical protein